MQRTPVTSSVIKSAGYDPRTRVLEIELHNASVYRYYDLDSEAYQQFLDAPSKGTHLNQMIKPNYIYNEVTSDIEDEENHSLM
ncbi:KTSC domain-containing protein [Deinococcus cellulosilyticus]|uniref:KTSC domain-containing protein n=1 Tax=Deinococcus cellulosilyticus (strain DSM 18568 / NBRC 106333 / KACC 11606 / 5516J-15) TaxID=1223518 RepID=A0A511MYX0_DEIC1|nr:KTSC domain-containing protein [Deinococcus cellulosilyticus]GEM45773.1 hypothetical protein DC3_14080 [Deinococcus cellulosilyticus NBRC 106333 = KACC 11606]